MIQPPRPESYVEYRSFPNVVFQVTSVRFNGTTFLRYLGSDSDKTEAYFLRKNGLAKMPRELDTDWSNLVEANVMLVLALVTR